MTAVNQPVQFRVLHVAQYASRVIQFSVVEIGEGGDSLGIQVGATRLQHQALRQAKGQLQPLKLRRQQGDVHLRVQQLLTGPGDLLLRWFLRQSLLMNEF